MPTKLDTSNVKTPTHDGFVVKDERRGERINDPDKTVGKLCENVQSTPAENKKYEKY